MQAPAAGAANGQINFDELVDENDILDRNHSWTRAVFYVMGLSMCITVDILQYSMPLAFLPSVLEDRGHSTMKIATAIGVYYWTGFAGGVILTSYQIWRVVCGNEKDTGFQSIWTTRRQIMYLIGGLTVGGVTLSLQALYPTYWMHTVCRCFQGFAGAFIFFYTFLLSVQLFKGQQQVFAMTAASTALNVAEVLGSFFGAVIFDWWGQRAVFWFLAVVSVINQVVLIMVIFALKSSVEETPRHSLVIQQPSHDPYEGWRRLSKVLRSKKLACAVIMIVMAAVVKGSVEEMLPFHADHQWGMEPLQIGQLFSIIAVFYILASVITGKIWEYLNTIRVLFSATFLAGLGFVSWMVFAVAAYYKTTWNLWGTLALYGCFLGLTHTPAALLLADAIEHEERESAKDAVNGIWNTMWEAGGSLGFLLGGLLAHHHDEQMELTLAYAVCCVFVAAGLLMLAYWPWSESEKAEPTFLGRRSSRLGGEVPGGRYSPYSPALSDSKLSSGFGTPSAPSRNLSLRDSLSSNKPAAGTSYGTVNA